LLRELVGAKAVLRSIEINRDTFIVRKSNVVFGAVARKGATILRSGDKMQCQAFWTVRIKKGIEMKHFNLVVVLLVIISLGCIPATLAEDHPLLQEPKVVAAITVLDAWIDAKRKDREQPGSSIGIVYDQDLVWAKGYGMADVAEEVPATAATVYRIASISKLFTSTAILQLRDAGKLQLDDPVVKHIPWFKVKEPDQDGPTITIRHLLTHTSGLPREATGVSWNELTFPSRKQMVGRLAEQEPVFAAEEEWKYSNLALSLAGEIVAEVSGEPWPEYVTEHILKPLRMSSTYPVPTPNTPGLAVGYGRRVPGKQREIEPFVDIEAERPAGNMASTVEDLAKFVSLQFRERPVGGEMILRSSTLREMHRVHWLRRDWKSGWGLGFAVRRVDELVRVGHGGSLPGHRTQIELAPNDKFGVIVLTNANDGDPRRYLDQAFKLVRPAIADATRAPKAAAKPDPAWQRYVGAYTWKHAEVQVQVLEGELAIIFPESDDPWESRVTLKPVGAHRFRATPNEMSYSLNGEILTFEFDDAGAVKRFGRPSFYWLRKQESQGP